MDPFVRVGSAGLSGARLAAGVGLLLLGAWIAGGAAADEVEGDTVVVPAILSGGDGYSDKGAEGCLECHNTPVRSARQNRFLKSSMDIFHTPHAQRADGRTPFADRGCETCHGPSRMHNEEPKKYPVAVVFESEGITGPSPADAQNEVCIQCHQAGLRMLWQGSQHQTFELACATCHDVHTDKDDVLMRKSQRHVCLDCHPTVRAQLFRFSRHPHREGKVVCSDCHNPHGSTAPRLVREVRINETCYRCHAEKRGPLLWEHPPVRDNCINCHVPHGSSQPRLLKQRPPYLCQQCHSHQFHPSTLYSGTSLPPTATNAGATSRILLKGCENCHSKVHGSNHPSGARFTR